MSLANHNSNQNNQSIVKDTNDALKGFKSEIIGSTEKIIKEYLPIKIVELSELFEEISTKQTRTEKIKYDGSSIENVENNSQKAIAMTNHKDAKKTKKKKRTFNDAFDDKDNANQNQDIHLKNNKFCAQNEEIERLTTLVKGEVEELIDYLDQIALFINLHVPKIEDGNNFGVQIQEQMKGMVTSGQLSAQDFLRNIPKVHTLRAKLISKIMKYPNLMDYQKAIIEVDYKQMLMLKHCVRDLRNNYWILWDVLNKNWDKIIKPKGEKNTFSMY
eukprot:668954_1